MYRPQRPRAARPFPTLRSGISESDSGPNFKVSGSISFETKEIPNNSA